MIRPLTRALVVLAAFAACTPTPTILPTNDLNRPTDIAFMCLGAVESATPGTFDVTGRPMSVCHPPVVAGEQAEKPAVSMQNRTFAFVPNSASGDLSVIDADSWRIVDLNNATGGYGRAPLGTLPEQISVTTDGCRLMSANRGSCDLSLVDPSTLLAPVFAQQYDDAGKGVLVNVPPASGIQTVVPRLSDPAGTPLSAAPYEAVFLPQDISQVNSCSAQGSWRALVTFPSCNLIALMEMPSGTIVSAAKAERTMDDKGRASVKLTVLTDPPTCSDECGSGRGPIADGGAGADGGMPESDAPRPTGIAIWTDATRAYVSFANVPAILPIDLKAGALAAAEPLKGIALNQGAQGSNRIRLGVDPYSFKTEPKTFPGRMVGENRNRSYLYVIARDGSLRIIDVFVPGEEKECETNFDALQPFDDPKKPKPTADERCIEYGTVHRRPYSNETAGLRFPTFPVDVAAADMGRVRRGQNGLEGDHREDTVAGGYAWVLTANGQIFLVNIDPVQRSIKAVVHQDQTVLFNPDEAAAAAYATQPFVYKNDPLSEGGGVLEPPPFPNRPRDRNFLSYSASLDPTLGLVRVDIPPINPTTGPYVEPFWTQGTEDNATATDASPKQTYVFFPDRDGAVAQGWDVVWQGTLVSPRYSGVLRQNVLRDGGGGFCSAGVQVGDIVTLNGCTGDGQCPLGMTCQRDETLDQVSGGLTVTGICISSNKNRTIDARCQPYVSSLRRYDIVKARQGELTLGPHYDELVRSSLTPCRLVAGTDTSGAAGMGGATGAAGAGGTAGGGAGGMAGMGGGGTGGAGGAGGTGGVVDDPRLDCRDALDSSTNNFKCVELAGQRRCLDPCTRQQDCRRGRVCLRACKVDADCTSKRCNTETGMCLANRQCDSLTLCPDGETCNAKGECEVDSYCVDGPRLEYDECFPQLTGYQVNVGAGFMVTGTQSGSFASGVEVPEDPNDPDGPRVCAPNTTRDRRLVSRIPVRPAPGQPESEILCDSPTTPVFPTLQTTTPFDGTAADNAGDGYYIDHFDPLLKPRGDGVPGRIDKRRVGPGVVTEESIQLVDWMKTWTRDVTAPNACIYMGGPVESDPLSDPDPNSRPLRPQHVRARFRNTQVAFVVANLDRAPASATTIHFEVHGGFRPQFVSMPTTVEISAPARLVLGPIDSNQKVEVTPGPAPFFFVVDQRRLGRGQGGGPTRGQIVRVNPFGLPANGYLPIYEDYTRSGNLFPIQ